MMLDRSISYITDLRVQNHKVESSTLYSVIKLKDAMDIDMLKDYLSSLGYHKQKHLYLDVVF